MPSLASKTFWLQRKLEEIACYASALAVATMMTITVLEVLARALFKVSLPGAYEYVSLMFVYLIYLGLGYTQRRDAHISVGILYDHFPRGFRKIIQAMYLTIAVLFFGALTWTSGVSAWSNFLLGDTVLGIVEVKTWWARAGIPVGLALFTARFLLQLINLFKNNVLLEEAATDEFPPQDTTEDEKNK